MADIIQLLPDAIANQIAAGEVIQRPASAVKELLENSVDAGATEIKLIIKDAGKTLIQVVDNGCGMSETDARMSFERHATSKIKNINDLFAIQTKGFRGEAMASIAAVAQVELRSRLCDNDLGSLIQIEDSKVIKQEPCQCPAGTNTLVKNLFYNVPARRNFLKSNPVETKHIVEEFTRVALAHPDIFFSLTHNDHEIFHLRAGNLRQRIVGVFGANYNEKLVPVDEQVDFMRVYGFIGKPEAAKKTRGDQYFFINNRFIKNNYLNHAVFLNYDELIPKDHFPFFCLFIDIDPARIDINVHPTKQEIKFDDERSVYGFVRVAARHALGKFSVTPTLDFEQEQSMNLIQSRGDDSINQPTGGHTASASSERNWIQRTITRPSGGGSNQAQWKQLYEDVAQPVAGKPEEQTITLESKMHKPEESQSSLLEPGEAIDRKPYQLHQKWVVSPIRSGFILVDQQSAHERVLYEHYLKAMDQRQHSSQQLLFPQTVQCSAQDAALLKEILREVNNLGFDIQEFGQHDFVVHGMPADLKGQEEQAIIEDLLESYKNNFTVLKLNKRESLARSIAQKYAIKSGQVLTTDEMKQLIDELFACEQPYIAPGGRLTFTTFESGELEKRFENK